MCLEGLTLRTVRSASGERSVVSFGPACNYIRLERCEIGGFCGLILPKTKEVTGATNERRFPRVASASCALSIERVLVVWKRCPDTLSCSYDCCWPRQDVMQLA